MLSVELIPMTEIEFQEFLETAIPDYAQDLARMGNASPEMALETSEKQFRELLPDGLASLGQYLYMTCDKESGQKVGYLWFAVNDKDGRRLAFIYDFVIFVAYRRQGYGQQAMLALEDKVRVIGLNEIRLHVFGDNQGARALYQKVGYVETNVNMAKHLGDQ